MTTDTSIRGALEHFAHVKGMALAPKWDDGLDDLDLDLGQSDLPQICAKLAWPAPEPATTWTAWPRTARPRATSRV